MIKIAYSLLQGLRFLGRLHVQGLDCPVDNWALARQSPIVCKKMYKINLSNFRCFYREQHVHLAPLTILVGENSTGKSSFLALIKTLWHILKEQRTENFNSSLFPLGRFNEIISRCSTAESQEQKFAVKVQLKIPCASHDGKLIDVEVEFSEHSEAPCPTKFRIIDKKRKNEIRMEYLDADRITATILTRHNEKKLHFSIGSKALLIEEYYWCLNAIRRESELFKRLGVNPSLQDQSQLPIFELIDSLETWRKSGMPLGGLNASAPIRSRPKRTYEQTGSLRDHEGAHALELLANIHKNSRSEWNDRKEKLMHFGKNSGLFKNIDIAESDQGSFKIYFQNSGEQTKNFYNIIDMGYGVSQALPILAELSASETNGLFLLQQPEVHLHPRAQAELGSLFCQLACEGATFLVETHSDYLLDRIRIDVRDQNTTLTHEMVSILFFVRKSDGVDIRTLNLDENGNIINAPPEYGDFFMDEKRKLLGL